MKAKNNSLKKDVIIIFYRLLICLVAFLGLCAPVPGTTNHIWFFTFQTNVFVIIIMFTLSIISLMKLFNINLNLKNQKWFKFLIIASTFYITITGIIYCFVLVPVAVATKSNVVTELRYRDIFLHIIVPVMTIIDFFVIEEKIKFNNKTAILFLIYPIIYILSIFLRPLINDTPFYGGSMFPYFFIDPTFNSQGYGMVAVYLLLCIVLFYLLGLLYIYLNNKIILSKENLSKKNSTD